MRMEIGHPTALRQRQRRLMLDEDDWFESGRVVELWMRIELGKIRIEHKRPVSLPLHPVPISGQQ